MWKEAIPNTFSSAVRRKIWEICKVTNFIEVDTLKVHMEYTRQGDEESSQFPLKLWDIVNNRSFSHIIRWDEVLDGFRKISPVTRSGSLYSDSDCKKMRFRHTHFIRDRPDLLPSVKRKTTKISESANVTSSASNISITPANIAAIPTNTTTISTSELSAFISEVHRMREREKSIDVKLSKLMKQHKSAWDELSRMRSTHIKQEHVINKLVHFLDLLVRSSQNRLLGKRNLLAIDGVGEKRPRISSSSSNHEYLADILDRLRREVTDENKFGTYSADTSVPHSHGPIIADVTDEPEASTSRAGLLGPACTSSERVERVIGRDDAFHLSDSHLLDEFDDYFPKASGTSKNCQELPFHDWNFVTEHIDRDSENGDALPKYDQLMITGNAAPLALDGIPEDLNIINCFEEIGSNGNEQFSANSEVNALRSYGPVIADVANEHEAPSSSTSTLGKETSKRAADYNTRENTVTHTVLPLPHELHEYFLDRNQGTNMESGSVSDCVRSTISGSDLARECTGTDELIGFQDYDLVVPPGNLDDEDAAFLEFYTNQFFEESAPSSSLSTPDIGKRAR